MLTAILGIVLAIMVLAGASTGALSVVAVMIFVIEALGFVYHFIKALVR